MRLPECWLLIAIFQRKTSLKYLPDLPPCLSNKTTWNLPEGRQIIDLRCSTFQWSFLRWGWNIFGDRKRWTKFSRGSNPLISDTVVLNMNSNTISSTLSSSEAVCGSVCHCLPPQEWNCISKTLHLVLFVLNGGQSYFLESILNSLSVFGWGSHVLDFGMLVQELLNTGVFDLSLVLPVDFVADQNKWELLRLFRGSLIEELSNPRFDVLERLTHKRSTFLLVMS